MYYNFGVVSLFFVDNNNNNNSTNKCDKEQLKEKCRNQKKNY